MAKISKRLLGHHLKAIKLLENETLSFDEREFVFHNYHEGAGKMNNLISAHFTPWPVAHSMSFNIRQNNFVDLCAGIGMLSYVLLRQWEMGQQRPEEKPFGICVERCVEYYEVGKKLLPEFHWINGDIFDPAVIDEIKSLMKGKRFSIISNPPYGAQVKTIASYLKYQGRLFEYRAIELGAILGAYDGAFLIPDGSCPFRITKRDNGKDVYHESYQTDEYKKFVKQTELEITGNNGFSTEIVDDDYAWRDVSIVTEIACVEYDELNYVPKGHVPFSPKPIPVTFSPKPLPIPENIQGKLFDI